MSTSSRLAAGLVAFLLLLALAACGDRSADLESAEPASAGAVDMDDATKLSDGAAYDAQDTAAKPPEQAAEQPKRQEVREAALIKRGNVSLSARDVAKARLQAQSIATKHDGEVTESSTAGDADGGTTYATMVLRVPSASFGKAMSELEALGTLRESTTDAEDVTTQVKDVDARVKVQRASIDRIRALLSAAKDIGDVVRIESELSRREADLDSLLSQQAYLGDQTSRSTINVDISRTNEDGPEEEREGFLGGLDRGWDGLVAFTSGALLALGVVVPWLPLIGIVALLLWWGVRRLRPAAGPREA